MKKLIPFKLPVFQDPTGILVPIEIDEHADFDIKRVYYLTNAKGGRGGHAVRNERKIYVCQKGEVTARFHDGEKWTQFRMAGPGDAVLMDGFYYREFLDFTYDAVLLALSSVHYNKDDYVFDFDEFLKIANS